MEPAMNAVVRTFFAGAALSLGLVGAASAQSCPSEPMFAGVSGPNADVRQSSRRVERGDFDTAAHFASEALESGTSNRNKNAAAINLCGALGGLGDAGAAEACADAIERNPESWEAYTNRGAGLWLAGDAAGAAADFARAAELGAGEDAVVNNSALAACAG
jgi:Flp pilus assembly protein TadD